MSSFEPLRRPPPAMTFDFSKLFYPLELSNSFESDEFDFATPLGEAIPHKEKLRYTYDFGSSTVLLVRSMSKREAKLPSGSIQIQAHNHPPEISCGVCGKPATQVCMECEYESTGWLCDKCMRKHECGDEMALPVVNSPRVGVYGIGIASDG